MTPPIRLPRGRRTVSAVVVALLLLIAALAVGYLAVLKAIDRPRGLVDVADVAAWFRETTFGSTVMLIIGIAIAVVGLIVLALAVIPSSRRLVELAVPDDHTVAGVAKRSLRRTVESSAVSVDGISGARAAVKGRQVSLSMTSSLRHTDGLENAAADAARQRLEALSLRNPRTLKTHLSRKDS